MRDALPAIGFIGLGIMGAPMAANLLRANFAIVVDERHAGRHRSSSRQVRVPRRLRALLQRRSRTTALIHSTPRSAAANAARSMVRSRSWSAVRKRHSMRCCRFWKSWAGTSCTSASAAPVKSPNCAIRSSSVSRSKPSPKRWRSPKHPASTLPKYAKRYSAGLRKAAFSMCTVNECWVDSSHPASKPCCTANIFAIADCRP